MIGIYKHKVVAIRAVRTYVSTPANARAIRKRYAFGLISSIDSMACLVAPLGPIVEPITYNSQQWGSEAPSCSVEIPMFSPHPFACWQEAWDWWSEFGDFVAWVLFGMSVGFVVCSR